MNKPAKAETHLSRIIDALLLLSNTKDRNGCVVLKW